MKQTGNGRESEACVINFVTSDFLERSHIVFQLLFSEAKVLSFNFIKDDIQDVA